MGERLNRAVSPLVLTSALAAGCTFPKASPVSVESVPNLDEGIASTALAEQCIAPAPEIMKMVHDLIEQPEIKESDSANYSNIDPSECLELLKDFKKRTARQLGLKYYDNSPVISKMTEDSYGAIKNPSAHS